MSTVAGRVSEWVDVAAELLQQPVGVFPVEEIAWQLRRTFESPSVSFNWRSRRGTPGLVLPAAPGEMLAGRPVEQVRTMVQDALDAGVLDAHPLLRWYAATGTTAPWSMGRVPPEIAGPGSPVLQDLFLTVGLHQQLSVPVLMCGRFHEAFVVTRPDAGDFADDDLEVARRIQPLLRALRVQVARVAPLVHRPAPIVAAPAGHAGTAREPSGHDLTGRELAVLGLLVRGYTATAIGHGLGMSPRTATKHVEHIYRKLGVRDRLTAAVVAREMGLGVERPPVPSR